MFHLGVIRTCGVIFMSYLALKARKSSVQAQTPLPVIPLPATAVQGSGNLLVDHGLQIVFEGYTEPRLERAGMRFFDTLARETGIAKVPAQPLKGAKFAIKTTGPRAIVQHLGEDESYLLEITKTGG